MPELPEVEAYRQLTEGAVGRRIAAVLAPDPHWLRVPGGVDELRAAVEGTVVAAARRRGKVLLVDLDRGRRRTAVVGLHFGMTGRLLLDGCPAVERLEYSSGREDPGWDRFGLRFAGRTGGTLVVRDPRRLGWVELDPDEDVLGPDAATLRLAELRAALDTSSAPLKARLLDQHRIAGIGNLLADEILWRAGLDPARPAGGLGDAEVRVLHRAVRHTIRLLSGRGGSHTGDLGAARREGGTCPRCGTPLQRRTVGGRTTYSCPEHQPAAG